METPARVLDLLDRWEEACAEGSELPPTVLCQDCPELIPTVEEAIRLLKGLAEMAPCSVPVLARPRPYGHARYTFTDFLDAGGMGEVWAGFDTRLKRHVALKILLARAITPDLMHRLREEACLGSKLERPGIVPVYDIGELPDGRPFLVMKLIKGKTLGGLLKHRLNPLHGLGRWIRIFEKVCRIVGYAHVELVLHRDLKPSNIMVDEQGDVHVLDWGIAKLLEEGQDAVLGEPRPGPPLPTLDSETTAPGSIYRTRSGDAMGTPPYMPPEQARGEVRDITTRSDVFGLGSILCVILTGKPPFDADTRRKALLKAEQADLTEALARLTECPADLELIALARWCLQPNPADRPCDAQEVTLALENYHQLCALRDSLPPAGFVTHLVVRHPYWVTVVLALLPHAIGATLVTVYSLLWAAAYWPEAFGVLSRLIVGYTLAALVVTAVLACIQTLPWLRVLRRIERREPITPLQVTVARQQTLRLQVWAYAFSAVGWLPGGFLLPYLLNLFVGDVDSGILAYFVLSFLLVGLIATTYCSLVVDFLILRIAYPRLWHLPRTLADTVRRELPRDPGRYRLLPLLATLVPLTASLVILVNAMLAAPAYATTPAGRLFQGLAILLVGLGMVGSVLAGMIAHYLRRVVSGFFVSLGLAIELPQQ